MSIDDSLPEEPEKDSSSESLSQPRLQYQPLKVESTLRMVETAFLASTASLIWFIYVGVNGLLGWQL